MVIKGTMMYYKMQDVDKKTNKVAGDGKGRGKKVRRKRTRRKKGKRRIRRKELVGGEKLHVYL